MAVTERAVEVVMCDDCGTEQLVPESGEYPPGYYGKVTQVTEDYGTAELEWAACKTSHIRGAILAVLAHEAQRVQG